MNIPQHLITKLEEVFLGDKDTRRSPLRHLLKSNATPSDSEIIAIRALISDAEASIEELHRRFPALDQESLVVETRTQLLRSIEAHRALLSPVRYLPSEILQEIFLHYADNTGPNITIASMPWRLGHISRRWRNIALSLPSLWDNIPKVKILSTKTNRLYVRALICLLQRSGTSPTLKFDISGYLPSGPSLRKAPQNSVIKVIMLHSERIEQLRIEVNEAIMPLFQGFKGRVPNLRTLRVYLNTNEVPNLDVFETAPALRQVAIGGLYQDRSVRILLPWSQITHFEEQLLGERVGQFVPLSFLRSLTYLDIDKPPFYYNESATLFSPYRPTTLPNLRILSVKIHANHQKFDLFLESLTIPAVEVMKILCMAPLIPRLISMFSGSHGSSRLQKLAFRTIPLQAGELSVLLNLTPHLVELEIDVPPTDDLQKLIYGEGEVILVPMLQALNMHSFVLNAGTHKTELLNTLAQVRCESGSRKDSEDATMPSLGPGTWTTLDTLRCVFYKAKSRDKSQKILNNWSSSFTPKEAKAINVINRCSNYIHGHSFVLENNAVLLMQDNFLACIEHYRDKVTTKVLHVGIFFWMLSCYHAYIFVKFFRRQIYTLTYDIISLTS